jgi:hypothetical protein
VQELNILEGRDTGGQLLQDPHSDICGFKVYFKIHNTAGIVQMILAGILQFGLEIE